MNTKELEKFIALLDTCTSDEPARVSLLAIHELSAQDHKIRLCATDAHIAVFADIDEELIQWALDNSVLFKREYKGQVNYVTYKKRGLCAENLYPYPQIMNVVHKDMKPLDKPVACLFDYKQEEKACKIQQAYTCSKARKNCFYPNYGNDSAMQGKYWIEPGLVILLMPLNPNRLRELNIQPVNEYVPGFLEGAKNA